MKNSIELVKSPLNYTGNKYRIIPQIREFFPKKINVMVDMFCGGFNVGVNVNANKIVGNDTATVVASKAGMVQ